MSGHWNFAQDGRMMHVAVMTNCEEVRLYLNKESVRVARPDAPDRMAHFYIPYRKGTVRAVGYRGGVAVCEDAVHTAKGPQRIALACGDLTRDAGAVAHVEATLLDEHGQPWTLDNPDIRFSVSGGADLVAVDNGDLTGDHDTHSDTCPVHLGHALAYLRVNHQSGTCTVIVRCGKQRAELQIPVSN